MITMNNITPIGPVKHSQIPETSTLKLKPADIFEELQTEVNTRDKMLWH